MHKLTGKQCKQARALLKWNVYDLASRVNGINPRRIESYERGMVHMAEWENDEMVTAFRKEGIQFNAELDVSLVVADKSTTSLRIGGTGEGARIHLDADQSIVEDTTQQHTPLSSEEQGEDRNASQANSGRGT